MAESTPQEFRTTLENFTGPLDLLLYLIRKHEVDILDIPISQVLEQYEEYVLLLKEMDVNLAADYLPMATTLMQIKSRMLLPQMETGEEEEDAEDPREDLVNQLLEYRSYKERVLDLSERLEETSRTYGRGDPNLPFALNSTELAEVSVWDLVTAFMRVQKAIAADRPREIVLKDRPLTFYVELVQEAFAQTGKGSLPFERVFTYHGPADRATLVGVFLAILELIKSGGMEARRAKETDEIVLRVKRADLKNLIHEVPNRHEGITESSEGEDGKPEAVQADKVSAPKSETGAKGGGSPDSPAVN